MKKIVLALAVGLIALGVQANSVNWAISTTATGTSYGNSANLGSFTAYLIQDSAWTGKAADLDNAVANTDWATSKDTGSARQYKTANPVVSTTSLDAGTYNFYVVLSDGTQYWASEAQQATVYEPGSTDPNNKSINLVFSGATAITAASLQTHSDAGGVPEPTSAMLLLMGGAMLALRRKKK